MYSILIQCAPGGEDALSAVLWELGTEGIAEEPGGLRAFFQDSVPLEAAAAALAGSPFTVRAEPLTDWAQFTRDSFPALLVGRRFFLVPPWNMDATPPGRLRLEINPGMACGTGWHPCTQMCLEALERHLKPGDAVLDVGAGSGILCQAARLLGAGLTVGCDLDFEAVTVARERLDTPLFAGSAESVRSGSFGLMIANISSAAAEELAPEFARIGTPGAFAILSGFSEADLPEGVQARHVLRQDGWACLVIAL